MLCLGRFVDSVPYTSSYRWLDIYYKSTLSRDEDYLTTADYYFRYDTECHWLTRTLPPLEWKPVRFALGKMVLGSTNLIRWSRRLEKVLALKRRPDVVCDVFIPARNLGAFWEWYATEFDFFPALDRAVPDRRALRLDRPLVRGDDDGGGIGAADDRLRRLWKAQPGARRQRPGRPYSKRQRIASTASRRSSAATTTARTSSGGSTTDRATASGQGAPRPARRLPRSVREARPGRVTGKRRPALPARGGRHRRAGCRGLHGAHGRVRHRARRRAASALREPGRSSARPDAGPRS